MLKGVSWVLPKRVIDLLAGWRGIGWGIILQMFGIWYHIV